MKSRFGSIRFRIVSDLKLGLDWFPRLKRDELDQVGLTSFRLHSIAKVSSEHWVKEIFFFLAKSSKFCFIPHYFVLFCTNPLKDSKFSSMRISWESTSPNPKLPIQIIPKQVFNSSQAKWIRLWKDLNWFELNILFESIRARIDWNLKLGWNSFSLLSRIKEEWIGSSRIDFWPFCIRRVTKKFLD